MPVSATTPVEEPAADVARHSADPFHAASVGEPLPLAEATPPQEQMPSHAGVSEIMSPTPSHMHPHEASPAHGLLAVESEPALQTSHEGTHSGNVQHAVPTASNFIQSHTHAPTTQPAQDPYAQGHNGNPGAAAPSNMGSRYGAPAQHPSAPHYDISGRDVPVEADPPPANRQYQPPATHQPSHQYSAVEERYEPELERMIPGMPHHAHSGSEDYTIRPNDSFYTISERVYGSGSYFKALEEHNRQRVPYSDRMRVGDVINTPRIEVLEEKYPDLCPKRRAAPAANAQSLLTSAGSHGIPGGKVYVVEQGDTLFDIARNELGKASRWSEIYELNRHRLGSDIDYLAPGTELMLPNAAAPVREPLTTERQRANATR
jgi:nucleoid-associated protein YgaU